MVLQKEYAISRHNFLACLNLQGVNQSAVAKFLPNFYTFRDSLIALFRKVPIFSWLWVYLFFTWVFYCFSEFLMDCLQLLGYLPDGLFIITSMSYCGGLLTVDHMLKKT